MPNCRKSVAVVLEKSAWNALGFLRQVRRAIQRDRLEPRSMPPEQPRMPTFPEPEPQTTLKAPRILVVDDDEGVRDILRLYLTNAGFRIDTSAGAREALRLIETDPPDLVTLDLRMPDMDGATFLGMLSKSETGRSVPVVIVTGAGDTHGMRALGASAVLEKPFRRHDLLSIARRLTQRPNQHDRPSPDSRPASPTRSW